MHTAVELPQKATAVCYRRHAYPSDNLPAVHAAATCCQDLPAAHTTVHTPGHPTCRSYYRAYRCSATAGHTAVYATETYRQDLPTGAYYRAMGPAPSGRVIRM